MVTVKGLRVGYQGKQVLEDVSFQLESGKIYGLIGENGVGKTTLLKILAGLNHYYSGVCMMDSTSVGALIEEPAAYANMTAKQNLEVFMGCISKPDGKRIDTLLDLVGLEKNTKKFKNFSLGMKKRFGIAIALMDNPKILLLDEPTSGLDIAGITDIREIIRKRNPKDGVTVISSHDTRDLSELCDEVMFLHKGKLVVTCDCSDKDPLELEEIFLDITNGRSKYAERF